jgi:hypothetical protein
MTGLSRLSALLVVLVPLAASSNEELARQGEEAFAEGVRLKNDAGAARPHFRAAAASFEALARRGVRNPLLYRDLGNAYFLADDLPRAILAYRCGLKLAPGDVALRENLIAAREEVVYPEGISFGRPADLRPPWLPRLGGGLLLGSAVVFYALAWVGFTCWFLFRRGPALLLGVVCLVGAGAWTAWLVVEQRLDQEGTVVVIADDGVLLRKGNGLSYPPRYETPLPRGAEARLLFERGDWLQIELAGGEVGWVPRRYTVTEGAETADLSILRAGFRKSSQMLAFRAAPVYSVAK